MFLKRRTPPELSTAELLSKAASGMSAQEKDKEKEKLTPEVLRQDKIEKKAAELKKLSDKDRLEQLDYFKFPTIMGWYFDGTFTKDFTLHEEYAEYFNEIEDELDAQRDLIIDETITEKAARNFWPPKFLLGGRYFRTRGIYLDFPEVREDPPKTPPNINYEKQRGVIGVELDDEPGKTAEDAMKPVVVQTFAYAPLGHRNSRDNWYWSESRREFRPKESDGDYIWTPDDKIWVEADITYRTPYDWYFDDADGKYYIRNRATPDLYAFDNDKNVYYKKDAKGPSSNGMRRNDYCFDEDKRKWVPITQASGNVTFYLAGVREIVKGKRGQSDLTPDDFYYDGETGKMNQKNYSRLYDYYYDTRDKMFKKKGQPYGPGKANHYPTDYEFDYKSGLYLPKHAKECKHIEPNDFYFDQHEGKWFLKDGHNRTNYIYNPELNIFFLKDQEGPSVNELSHSDYYWNEHDRTWKLIVTVKDPNILAYHDAGKRRVLKGERGRSGKAPDDFYYDAIDGSFFRKDPKKLNQYWFDVVDMVWKKKAQPYGPGYFRLYPEHYYFDYDEGFYFPTTTAKHLLAKLKNGEIKGLSDHTPYDYAFNEMEGSFQLRDKDLAHASRYNSKAGVFVIEAPKTSKEPTHGKSPKDFFYDEFSNSWLPIEHPKGHEAKYYKFGRRNNRTGPRGRTGKITDDYYFDFETGEFELKEREDKEDKYEYMPDVGVWRAMNVPRNPNSGGNVPRVNNYYFDKEEGKFILKKKLQFGEIYLNPFTNLWMQRWRCPHDYYWENRQQKYMRKAATQKEKEMQPRVSLAQGDLFFEGGNEAGPGQAQAVRQAELVQTAKDRRDYERPWLHNFLVFAADEVRFEQELLKSEKRKQEEHLLAIHIEKEQRKSSKEETPRTAAEMHSGVHFTPTAGEEDDASSVRPTEAATESSAVNETTSEVGSSKRKKKDKKNKGDSKTSSKIDKKKGDSKTKMKEEKMEKLKKEKKKKKKDRDENDDDISVVRI